MLEQGLHLGYRRRATGGTWIARRHDENGIYHAEKLALADDVQDANAHNILDFSQAQRAALDALKDASIRAAERLKVDCPLTKR